MSNRIILASSSPRRIEMLKEYEIDFEVIPSSIEEVVNEDLSFEDIVVDLAIQKAASVYKENLDATIIACDTLVFTENEILQKPIDKNDAFSMLKKLSGITHQVISGVCVIHQSRIISFFDITDVTFKELSNEEINEYLSIDEYKDKCGSYAFQGEASKFVTKISGSIENVIGLPIDMLIRILKELELI